MSNVTALEAQHVLQTYKRQPVVFVRGEGTRLFDENGRSYLDFISGIGVCVLGHADPLVMDAVGIARATLAGLRSAPLLALLEDAVAMGGRPEAGSGAGARRASAARDSSVEAEAGPR